PGASPRGGAALEGAIGLEIVDGALDGLEPAPAPSRLGRGVLVADPPGLIVHRGDRAVVEIGDPVRLARPAAGGEAQLEGPGAVLPAPCVPGRLPGRLPCREPLGDDVEQRGAATA